MWTWALLEPLFMMLRSSQCTPACMIPGKYSLLKAVKEIIFPSPLFFPLRAPVCEADTTWSWPACTRSGWRLPDPPHFTWWKTELGISILKSPGDFSYNLVKENRKKKVEQCLIQCCASWARGLLCPFMMIVNQSSLLFNHCWLATFCT